MPNFWTNPYFLAAVGATVVIAALTKKGGGNNTAIQSLDISSRTNIAMSQISAQTRLGLEKEATTRYGISAGNTTSLAQVASATKLGLAKEDTARLGINAGVQATQASYLARLAELSMQERVVSSNNASTERLAAINADTINNRASLSYQIAVKNLEDQSILGQRNLDLSFAALAQKGALDSATLAMQPVIQDAIRQQALDYYQQGLPAETAGKIAMAQIYASSQNALANLQLQGLAMRSGQPMPGSAGSQMQSVGQGLQGLSTGIRSISDLIHGWDWLSSTSDAVTAGTTTADIVANTGAFGDYAAAVSDLSTAFL